MSISIKNSFSCTKTFPPKLYGCSHVLIRTLLVHVSRLTLSSCLEHYHAIILHTHTRKHTHVCESLSTPYTVHRRSAQPGSDVRRRLHVATSQLVTVSSNAHRNTSFKPKLISYSEMSRRCFVRMHTTQRPHSSVFVWLNANNHRPKRPTPSSGRHQMTPFRCEESHLYED